MNETKASKIKNVEKRSKDLVGNAFCEFYMGYLKKKFNKISGDLGLHFSDIQPDDKNIVCIGHKKSWVDSRLEANKEEYQAVWWVEGDSNSPSKRFFEIIVEELEKRFTSLLQLKEVEDRLNEEKFSLNPLVSFFIGDLLNKEWLVARYIEKIIKEMNLPSIELLIQIAAQKYEKRTVKTSMYFIEENYEKNEEVIIFNNINRYSRRDRRLTADNLRTIRKLMEMSGEGQGLLVCKNKKNTYYIDGIASSQYIKNLSIIEIKFTGHLNWEIIENKEVIFQCKEGQNKISVIEEYQEEWKEKLKSVMGKLHQDENFEKIELIINTLKKQSHGTSIVFMQKCMLKKEVHRLASYRRGYPIYFNMTAKNIEDKIGGISAVDGAIFADIKGYCYCVGTIVDGEATIKGDSGSGARHNSLITYINWVFDKYQKNLMEEKLMEEKSMEEEDLEEWVEENLMEKGLMEKEWMEEESEEDIWCFAVVLSEDKMITFVTPEKLDWETVK